MAIIPVDIGSGPNAGDGDPLRTAFTTLNANDAELDTLKAPKASPTFTGTPAAPTASGGTNTTQLATTAFVQAAIAALIASAPGALDTLDELAAAFGDDANFAATMATALSGKQPLDSDLTAIAALTTTAFGRSLLAAADDAALRTLAALGTAATVNTGTSGGTVPLLNAANTFSGMTTLSERIAVGEGGATAVNGANQNLTMPAVSMVEVTGPSGAFNIGGLTGGAAGRMLILLNGTSQTMTLNNQDAGSSAANRIYLLSATVDCSRAILVWKTSFNGWLLVSYS